MSPTSVPKSQSAADDVHRAAHTLTALCPALADGFDLMMDDPHPVLAPIREQAPVFYDADHGVWCVTRHEDVLAIYRDPVTFSNVGAHDLRVPLPPAIVAEVGPDYTFPTRGHLNTMDPPEHTRVRKLMQKAFTPRRVNEREGMIRDLANGLVDRFIDDGRVELVTQYTSPIPVNVVAVLLGSDQD